MKVQGNEEQSMPAQKVLLSSFSGFELTPGGLKFLIYIRINVYFLYGLLLYTRVRHIYCIQHRYLVTLIAPVLPLFQCQWDSHGTRVTVSMYIEMKRFLKERKATSNTNP